MNENKFAECTNCGALYYVIDKKRADKLKDNLINGFSKRDLTRCSKCGSKKDFKIVFEAYMSYFSPDSKIEPIFLDYEKLKKAFKNKS